MKLNYILVVLVSIMILAILLGCEKEATVITSNPAVQQAQMVAVEPVKPEVKKEEPKLERCDKPAFAIADIVKTVQGGWTGQVGKINSLKDSENGYCWYTVYHYTADMEEIERTYWEFQLRR